jgi:hypothetical protein
VNATNKIVAAGWIIQILGMALWTFGYFVGGHPPFVDWPAYAPHWIAEFLPTWQAELGMIVMFVGMIPIYWKPGRHQPIDERPQISKRNAPV